MSGNGWPNCKQCNYKNASTLGADVEFDLIEIARNYVANELPNRLLDAALFGGIGGTVWLLATGRARRRKLHEFLHMHVQYLKRLKRVVDVIRSKGEAKAFRDVVRRELNDTHARLKGQQLHLFAVLSELDQRRLLSYFDRVDQINKTFEFSVPGAMISSGALEHTEIGRFKENIRDLFEPDVADGAATEAPVEHACLALERIVWSVYMLPILKQSAIGKSEARAIDASLNEIRATLSKLSADRSDWGPSSSLVGVAA